MTDTTLSPPSPEAVAALFTRAHAPVLFSQRLPIFPVTCTRVRALPHPIAATRFGLDQSALPQPPTAGLAALF